MRNIDKELLDAQEELRNVKGLETEVYTRICGYFRPLKNWNQGKRAEYAERKSYGNNRRLEKLQT